MLSDGGSLFVTSPRSYLTGRKATHFWITRMPFCYIFRRNN
jgi:hypothetical protein